MARAYAYVASDGPIPQEIRIARLVQRFGAQSIYGRPMGAKEIRNMEYAESVVNAYQERDLSGDWAVWAEVNVDRSNFLNMAMKYAIDLGMINDG